MMRMIFMCVWMISPESLLRADRLSPVPAELWEFCILQTSYLKIFREAGWVLSILRKIS